MDSYATDTCIIAMKYWYEEACFYHLFTFGVCNAPFQNPYGPTQFRLKEIEKWIPHILELNCNAVLFSPVFESRSHGYDTTDYYHLDTRIGNNDSLKDLIQKLHDNQIRVVLDGVFNHCGRDFFAFKDILLNGSDSKYINWFVEIDFSKSSPLGDPFTYDTWNGYYELPKFNLNNPAVIDYLLDAVQYWIEYFNIDGLRLDAADHLDFNFMKALSKKTRALKNDFWLMGEVVHGNYSDWLSKGEINTVTNYEVFKGIYSSHNDQNLFEIAYSLDREFNQKLGSYNHFFPYNFVDNHDQNRLASLLEKSFYLYTSYILLFTIPGIPSLYYGSEWGLKGVKEFGSDLAIRPYIDIENVKPEEVDLEKVIKKLSRIRKESPALKAGDYKQISIEYQKPFIFERRLNGQTVVVIVNATPSEHFVTLSAYHNIAFYDVLNDEHISPNDMLHLKVSPYWGRILNFKG